MASHSPLYTRDNCSFSCPLQWGLSVFWRVPMEDRSWQEALTTVLETDDIRLLGHRFSKPGVSQFALSTKPEVAPLKVVQRVKGRLQYLVRAERLKAFKGNYAIRGFGQVTRETIDRYVAEQLEHHVMADSRVQARLEHLQFHDPTVDLSKPQQTSHGLYWYNLHLVLVHRQRLAVVDEDLLQAIRAMIVNASRQQGYLLSRAGILADHLHLLLGCPIDTAPIDVALGFLNNLAFVHGMRPVHQYGAFVGTFGEYDQRAVVSDTC